MPVSDATPERLGRAGSPGRVRVHNFSVSLDGFGVGEGQSLEAPFGQAGMRLMQWAFGTSTFQRMQGRAENDRSRGIDEAFAARWNEGIGVEIMGRNKFAPLDQPWPNDEWEGWWGDEPPFHTPVVVLTHSPREPLVLGETTFHFVEAEPAEALSFARSLAGGGDVRIGGGTTTVRAFLQAGLIDEAHIVVVPVLLGRGERLWDGLEGLEERYVIEQVVSPSGVVHLTLTRRAD